MPRPAKYQKVNIHFSVLNRIGETVTVDAVNYPVYHERAMRDPEERRRPAATPDVAWVETHWTQQRAGMGQFSLLQIDVRSRVGTPTDPSRDELGDLNDAIMDEVLSLFLGNNAVMPGRKNFNIAVLDMAGGGPPFAELGTCVMCQPSSGRFGSPESETKFGLRDGLWKQTAILRFRMPRDTGHQAAFYTE